MTVRQPPPGRGDDIQREYTEDIEPYWFRWADQWWELPHRKMLDFKKVLRVATLQDRVNDLTAANVDELIDELNGVFVMLMGPKQGAEFVKVEDRPLEFLMDTITRWRAHSSDSEEAEGESSASSDSSKASTRRPSKRTSKASSASASRKPFTPRARKSDTPRANSSSASAG